jgi:3-phosphoshikimate 1-carboxyvinyltransferase
MKLRIRPVTRFVGAVSVPGDKSISHRAALLAALAEGVSQIEGYLEAEDCLGTLAAVAALGAGVELQGRGRYRIVGRGLRGLREPENVIDCGNSGTTARLLLGVLAGQPFWSVLSGDASLRARPMGRVADPLRRMGATVVGRADGGRLPLAIRGAERTRAIAYQSPVASAQVKSAVLLAGLYADAPVSVTEPAPSRDHTERMLRQFSVHVEAADRTATIVPGPLRATALRVPGDFSSAAFLLVAAVTLPNARVTIGEVGVNPTRTGLLDVLEAMGAGIDITGTRGSDGEAVATLAVASSALTGTKVGGVLVPRLIDEVPALAVAALAASGTTEIADAAELRVKESDRISALARELGKMGARIVERPDGMVIEGPAELQGAEVDSGGDHRVAMALAVAALRAAGETVIHDVACVATSYPTFAETVNMLAGGDAVTLET